MLVRKYQWMGIISLILTLLLLSDSLIVRATETGTLIGDGTTEDTEQYTVDDEKIWALIDRDELRSLVDVDFIKETVDLDALRSEIDMEPLLEQISDINLLNSMKAEEILEEYNDLKELGELDDLIKVVVESEDFDEEFIKNHPVDVPNVKVPLVSGESPLDYILDPMELIYQTQAAKYGGGSVQEGANVLFRNNNGEYLFSDTSDMLEIVNKGNVPLQVSIIAKIENADYVKMVDSSSMLEGSEPSIFMALVGDDGILAVMNETGSSEITLVLDAVPEGTYKYTLNEETGKYESKLSEDADESKFDSFVFGVTGKCNSEASWEDVYDLPRISITWKTEPVLTDWDKITEELEESDKVKFEAYKKVKLEELRQAELERLIQLKIDDMIYEELDELIDEEVERLAQVRFDELKELAIRGQLDYETGEPLDSEGMLILEDEDAENAGDDADGAGNDSDGAGADDEDHDGAVDEIGGDGDEGDVIIENDGTDGTSARAGSTGNKSAVLGATRERIEFIESDEDDETYDYEESSQDNEPEFFDSEDSTSQEQSDDSGDYENQDDTVIFF